MKEYELWLEGFAVTGQNGKASLEGKEFGSSFEEAMRNYAKKYPLKNIKEKNNEFFI